MPAVNLFKQSSIANIAEAYPLRFFDIGARGGFDTSLWPVAFASEAIGFEPNPDEFKLLSTAGDEVWMNSRYLPVAVSGGNGIRTLNVPVNQLNQSTSVQCTQHTKQHTCIPSTPCVDTQGRPSLSRT